ncbi:hypothetical protein [Cellulomonas bogoriensis]|uniref:Uncharacterized protein n=1 Tax=Cellulomonas bogoriensis 69B4 = DSM 16987 TaxID=1386082 RepID=A0A0A0BNZ3_9CELL|nr:hypothetical protein [Cellulomonas bogoriensis]KGM08774.1 hypothetical protein N869_06785 [Cellulomonas bogoriensis 69B4 = DSM 16987]
MIAASDSPRPDDGAHHDGAHHDGAHHRDAQHDPDVLSLAPTRSTRRTVLTTTLVVALLGGAAVSPLVLRPSLTGTTGWGASATTTEEGDLVTVVTLTSRAWPSATLTDVEDVPGAQAIGVWLRPRTGDPDEPLDWWPVEEDGTLVTQHRAPARFGSGEVSYAVLWRVTDCDALDPAHTPTARGTTALGTPATIDLAEPANPGEHVELLVENGVCSEGSGA